jgi:hypothetical protein
VSTEKQINEEIILSHSAVVITQYMPIAELVRINELCRSKRISFFYAFTGGISADIFVDHGVDHIVNDFNGERPIQKLITAITPLGDASNGSTECLVRYETPEGSQPMALQSGFFEISEVEGVEGINGATYPLSHEYKVSTTFFFFFICMCRALEIYCVLRECECRCGEVEMIRRLRSDCKAAV